MATQVVIPAVPVVAALGYRKSVTKLTDADLADLRRAFAALKDLDDDRGFWYFAGWHGVPFNWCEHHTDLFLPWHRAYLYYMELALASQVPGVTLPWWDWGTAAGVPDAYTVEQVDGGANPLLPAEIHVYRSTETRDAGPRAPGAARTVPDPPRALDLAAAMAQPTFGTFQQAIEQIHDDMHVWTGGIMVDIEWAAYDPLFFAHHTMIDRAWRLWQHRHPGALPPQQLLDVPLRPNGMTVRQTLDVTQLGYEYAGTQSMVPGTQPVDGTPGGGTQP